MSTAAEQFIQIDAEVIEDVRKGAFSELGTASERLYRAIDDYAYADADKRDEFRTEYYEADDAVGRFRDLFEDMGDDLDMHEPIRRLNPKHAPQLAAAAARRSEYLRDVSRDTYSQRTTAEIRALCDRIDALDELANRAASLIPAEDEGTV